MANARPLPTADALSGLAPGSFAVSGTSNDLVNGQIVITGRPSQFTISQNWGSDGCGVLPPKANLSSEASDDS